MCGCAAAARCVRGLKLTIWSSPSIRTRWGPSQTTQAFYGCRLHWRASFASETFQTENDGCVFPRWCFLWHNCDWLQPYRVGPTYLWEIAQRMNPSLNPEGWYRLLRTQFMQGEKKKSREGLMEHADEEKKKLIRGERWSWKVTPCVWSPCIRCPVGRHARTMLIFKSLGCLFKVSNWYLPLEEFPPIWHRVWEQGESSLPGLPAVGMCYATGNTLALVPPCFFGVHCNGSTKTTHTATFMGFGWGFLLSLPNCLLSKLSINKQRNAMPLFGLEPQLKHFQAPFFRDTKEWTVWGERRHLNLKIWALTGRSWRFGSSNMKRSLTELLSEFIFWFTRCCCCSRDKVTSLPPEDLLITAPFKEMLKWSWLLWSQPFWHLKTQHDKVH